MLQLNNGDGIFNEIAQLAGISNTDLAGTLWLQILIMMAIKNLKQSGTYDKRI